MKRVVTVGVFDLFHFGHLKLFQNAKKTGDYLIVAVQNTESVLKYKPRNKILYSTKERKEMIEALKIVDEVVIYSDVDSFIQTIDFDVFAKGPDQIHEGFRKAVEYCEKHQKKVVILPRTQGISSTYIKNFIADMK